MRVKICGLTRAEDARLAIRLGAWGLGFIFAPQSPRCITPEQAEAIVPNLGSHLLIAGVFVDQNDAACDIARRARLTALQLHGNETPDDCAKLAEKFSGPVIKALRPTTDEDLRDLARYAEVVNYILIDAPAPGQATDPDLALRAAECGAPIILAGGLNPANIAAAARIARPFALDLSSGVESSPGVKDAGKMEAVFGAVRGG